MTTFIQNHDKKAECWAHYFVGDVVLFSTPFEWLLSLLRIRRCDLMIFRYQNSHRRLSVSLFYVVILAAVLIYARLLRAEIVWINHNVERETSDNYRLLSNLRRCLLLKLSHRVLVLDELFIPYVRHHSVSSISFGRKDWGSISKTNQDKTHQFSQRYGLVILLLGQDKSRAKKYATFENLCGLARLLHGHQLDVGFVTIGMDANRELPPDVERHVLRIQEPSLAEAGIAEYVDCVYKANLDLSMPYTIYAAASAGLPMLVEGNSPIWPMIQRENLGMRVSDLIRERVIDKESFSFKSFLEKNSWQTLAATLGRLRH